MTPIGTGGAAVTFLDAGGGGTGVTVAATGGAGLTLEGLTLRSGKTSGDGGGINCDGSVLTLVADTVSGNHADVGGGGLYARACTLAISMTRFESNTSAERGGGAFFMDSYGEVRDSQFTSNGAAEGAGLAIVSGWLPVRKNLIEKNTAGLQGGGLYYESTAPIEDNVIDGNHAGWTGGGVYLGLRAPVFKGNTVNDNTSANDGGGMYVHVGDATITDNRFTGNRCGDDGGGIRIFESRAHVEGNLIEDNVAADSGGGVRISHLPSLFVDNLIRGNRATVGGGIDMDNDSSHLRGGSILGNKADRGGGIHAVLAPWSDALIEDVLIAENHAAWRGGGMALDDNFQPVTLRRLTVIGNTAGYGAGLSATSTDFRISNSLFAGNTASADGGAIYIHAPEPFTAPCPCPPTQSAGRIEFVTMHENAASSASALYTSDPGSLSVRSSILSANGGTAVQIDTGAPTPGWRYNDTMPASFSGMTDPTGSGDNIAADPLFVDPASGSFHLMSGSPAVNAGDPDLYDKDGSRSDMGLHGGPGAP